MTKHFCDRCERELGDPKATAVFVVEDWRITDADRATTGMRTLPNAPTPRVICSRCAEGLTRWLASNTEAGTR
jgi:hypothetical protein